VRITVSQRLRNVITVGFLMLLFACSDSDNGGGSGGPLIPSGSGQGPSGATITIGANGAVSPSTVSITTGQSVTVVNNDTRPHEISSDPHPNHTACPSINALGTLAAGQTRLTNLCPATGTCGFHDHINPDTAALKGTITVR
jgi:plastocyanin